MDIIIYSKLKTLEYFNGLYFLRYSCIQNGWKLVQRDAIETIIYLF